MLIKRLTPDELSEGLTLELVNKIKLSRKCSPAMFRKGDEPVQLMECSKGYWVLTSDGYLRDDKNNLIVFGERECQVARARYVMNFGEEEKRKAAANLLEIWKNKVKHKLEELQGKIEYLTRASDEKSTEAMIRRIAIEQVHHSERGNLVKAHQKDLELLPKLKELHQSLTEKYNNGEITYLLSYFGLEHFNNPESFQLDSPEDMKTFKNTFNAQYIDESQGNVSLLYARLRVEREYEW